MASDVARRAKEAFVDDDFELAVDLNTRALELDPANADLYADRAQANIKLNNCTQAVADANKAIELAPTMSKAYLRKGTACIKLEEYQTAKAALEAGFSLAPTDSRFTRLIEECDEHIAEEINRLPKQVAHAASPIAAVSSHDGSIGSAKEFVPIRDASCHQSVKVSSKPKYRHDHYNTPTEVVLTIFAKDIPEKYVNIDFGEQIISVTIDIPGEDTYLFQHRLFAKSVS
ncbi:suppressor of G2 allele of SKP1 [Musa troglodytarum]|uniref:Suppressor of G2 allele of SKP1 n=1 Tax=Musa troglodytarum TaxID=320322 RepID=A0A9E7K0M5_9LILI|nr:suppressor of G2 allele of SKP1 [Musa troglodytarum]